MASTLSNLQTPWPTGSETAAAPSPPDRVPSVPEALRPGGGTPADDDLAQEPLSSLRGASVSVDVRRLGRALAVVGIVGVVVLAVVLAVAGADTNARVTALQRHGVPVTAHVTGCTGLLGGSGSNGAGYACQGTYEVAGRHFTATLPVDTALAPGSTLALVSVADQPHLIATPQQLAAEHASARVYLVPGLLMVGLVLAVAGTLVVRRRRSHASTT